MQWRDPRIPLVVPLAPALHYWSAGSANSTSCERRATGCWRRWPEIKVLFTTGYTGGTGIIAGRLGCESAIVTKPFTSTALLTKARSLLGSAPASSQTDG